MAHVINPNDFNKLVDLTRQINLIPNGYTRIGDLGLFAPESVMQDSVVFDRTSEETYLLSDTKNKGNQTLSSQDWEREVFSLVVPEFHYSDYITPRDIKGVRRVGTSMDAEAFSEIQGRKLAKLRRLHNATHEYMRVQAIKGITKTPDGKVYANMYNEFGVTEKTVFLNIADTTSDVGAKLREVARLIEDNLLVGTWSGDVHIFVSTEMFEGIITHPSITEVYGPYLATNQVVAGAQPLRDDQKFWAGRQFRHMNIVIEEMRGGYTNKNGFERFIEAEIGHAIPLGIDDMFTTYQAPANKFSFVNTPGQEMYAWQRMMDNDEQFEIESFSSVLPVCRRPHALVKLSTAAA